MIDTQTIVGDLQLCRANVELALRLAREDPLDRDRLVRREVGSESRIDLIQDRRENGVTVEDMQHRTPDISRAREDLGWEPQVPLWQIIAEAVELASKGVAA